MNEKNNQSNGVENMTEKNILRNLKNITESKKILQTNIQNKIMNIFKEFDSEDDFYAVEFDDYGVVIHLDDFYVISTDLFFELNKLFGTTGILFYDDNEGYGFISFEW